MNRENEILDYNSDEAIQEQLRAEQEWVRGYNSAVNASMEQGLEKGKAEGKKEANIATAKKMKLDGLSNEMISKYTGLTFEEINQL